MATKNVTFDIESLTLGEALAAERTAPAHVGRKRRPIRLGEHPEDEGSRHLLVSVVALIAVLVHDKDSSARREPIAARSRSRPWRMRVFTVPSGVRVRSAISAWVRPSK